MEQADVPKAQREACAALVKALPGKVSDQERRSTGTTYAAAWGDPAIVLRCGVPKPEDSDPFAPCQTVNGVDWVAPEKASNEQSSDVTLTTSDTVPLVELTVPAQYRPPVAALVDVAEAVGAHTRSVKHCS